MLFAAKCAPGGGWDSVESSEASWYVVRPFAQFVRVRARGGTPDSEQRLRKQVRKLKELRVADAEEIARLKADVEGLVGALHQATTENQLLRQEPAERTSVIRGLPVQLRRPSAPAQPGRRGWRDEDDGAVPE